MFKLQSTHFILYTEVKFYRKITLQENLLKLLQY